MIESTQKKVNLPQYEIDKICTDWGDHKYTTVFKLIAEHPAILTHEVMRTAPCNNVPDMAICINRRLKRIGLEVACTPPKGKSPVGNSHNWHLVAIDNKGNKAMGGKL